MTKQTSPGGAALFAIVAIVAMGMGVVLFAGEHTDKFVQFLLTTMPMIVGLFWVGNQNNKLAQDVRFQNDNTGLEMRVKTVEESLERIEAILLSQALVNEEEEDRGDTE